MAKKKLLSGNGWSFEPADAQAGGEQVESLPDSRQKVRISLEKRAKGKEVTVVSGFVLAPDDRKRLAAKLKKACGSGGTDSDDAMEIQGDRRDTIGKFLLDMGWKVS